MASFSKYQASSIGRLFLHNNRRQGDGVTHSNENIDDDRTQYNYYYKRGSVEDVNKRLSEIVVIKRKTAVEVGEMVVTLPKDVREGDERKFFQSVYDFYCRDFGERNIINAVVHKDEITPHIHIDFIPTVKEDKEFKNAKYNREADLWRIRHPNEPVERLCCRECIDRNYLRSMHSRLSKYVESDLGYRVEILNGATAGGNKTVAELKLKTLNEEIAKVEKKKEELSDDIELIKKYEDRKKMIPLLKELEIYQGIVERNDYTYTIDELERLRNLRREYDEESEHGSEHEEHESERGSEERTGRT